MELLKIDIQTKLNLTLLAKAYWENLFPMPIFGYLYYDIDLSNCDFPVRYLYFKKEYYSELIQHINNTEILIRLGNLESYRDWKDLIDSLNKVESVENVDVALLRIYTPSKTNYDEIKVDNLASDAILTKPKINSNELKNIIFEIELDLKRIYIGVNISVSKFEKGKGISIHIPFADEKVQRFSFKPILQLLSKYDQLIEDINLYKGKNSNEIWVSVTIKEW